MSKKEYYCHNCFEVFISEEDIKLCPNCHGGAQFPKGDSLEVTWEETEQESIFNIKEITGVRFKERQEKVSWFDIFNRNDLTDKELQEKLSKL